MTDLLQRMRAKVYKVKTERAISLLKDSSADLQSVYDFHVTSENSFSEIEEYLKNLYTTFNYAAVIVNDALKKKSLDGDSGELIDECLDIMLKCCDKAIEKLQSK